MKGHVSRRGNTFAYWFDIDPDPLTGKRRQQTKSGFESEKAAWKQCRAAISEYEKGRIVKASRRKVGDALTEWLTRIEHSIKPSMAQNWRNYAAYYVTRHIGLRAVQDLNGGICDALYAKLLAEGRVKAQPKKKPAERPVHVRRVTPDGRRAALPSLPLRHCAVLPATRRGRFRARTAHRGQEATWARGRRYRKGGAEATTAGPGTQNGHQHPPHAALGLGGLRGLGLGQTQRRQRRAATSREVVYEMTTSRSVSI